MSTVTRKTDKKRPGGKVDWAKIRATSDADITRQIEEETDAAPDMSGWDLSDAKLVRPLQPAK